MKKLYRIRILHLSRQSPQNSDASNNKVTAEDSFNADPSKSIEAQ